jgi:hypothetical protein
VRLITGSGREFWISDENAHQHDNVVDALIERKPLTCREFKGIIATMANAAPPLR